MTLEAIDFDFDNYNPDDFQQPELPPAGDYEVVIIGVEDKRITQANNRLIDVHFEIYGGAQTGKRFNVGYYIGNPKLDDKGFPFASQVAKQKLAGLYKAITGTQLTNALWSGFEGAVMFKHPVAVYLSISTQGERKYANLSFKKKEDIQPALTSTSTAPIGAASANAAPAPWGVR